MFHRLHMYNCTIVKIFMNKTKVLHGYGVKQPYIYRSLILVAQHCNLTQVIKYNQLGG